MKTFKWKSNRDIQKDKKDIKLPYLWEMNIIIQVLPIWCARINGASAKKTLKWKYIVTYYFLCIKNTHEVGLLEGLLVPIINRPEVSISKLRNKFLVIIFL